MNRRFRSFLSIFLSAVIAVTAIPLTAYAETEYFENAAETEEVVLVEESAADDGINLTFEPQTASVKQEMKA